MQTSYMIPWKSYRKHTRNSKAEKLVKNQKKIPGNSIRSFRCAKFRVLKVLKMKTYLKKKTMACF